MFLRVAQDGNANERLEKLVQRQLAEGAALVANLAVLGVDFVEEQVDTCARRDARARQPARPGGRCGAVPRRAALTALRLRERL